MKLTSLVSKLFTAGKTLTQPQGDKDKNHLTGPCGEHAEWAFSPGDGRLRIFGTGATHDFFGARKLPWKPFLPSIRIICVEEGITYVGFQAFCYANHVEEVRLPLSLLHIGQHCFSYCTDLSAIQLPEKLQAIGDYAFAHCTSLREIVLPASLVRVGKSAFARCSRLASATFLSAGSTDIGKRVFAGCYRLARLSLPFPGSGTPASFRNFGELFGTLPDKEMRMITQELDETSTQIYYMPMNLSVLQIKEGCEILPPYAFFSCHMLKQVHLPSTLYLIGHDAFRNCAGLAAIYCQGKSPAAVYENAFEGVRKNVCRLLVPAGCRDIYKQEKGWKYFSLVEEHP